MRKVGQLAHVLVCDKGFISVDLCMQDYKSLYAAICATTIDQTLNLPQSVSHPIWQLV